MLIASFSELPDSVPNNTFNVGIIFPFIQRY
jgi:hypothetical protein